MAPDYRSWRIRIFAATWTMYASYYLTRVNMSLAQPVIRDDLGFTDIQMGWITTAMLIAYGVGQVVNGVLGDRLGARAVVTFGMIGSAVCNLLFGLSPALWAMVALWAANGFMQSTGAPMRIKTIANWFPPERRGRIMGLCGTDYQVGNLVCWLVVGLAILPNMEWRYAFVIPAVVLLVSWVHFFLRMRNEPEDVGLPPIETGGAPGSLPEQGGASSPEAGSRKLPHPEDEEGAGHGWRFILKQSLGNPRVWLVGLAYFGVDLVRYGFLVWAPTYMYDQGAPLGETAYKMAMMPAAAVAGIVVSGFVSDRIGGRRAPVISVMLFAVAALAWVYPRIPSGAWLPTMACLAAIGFFLYGPHLMMGATIAMDLGSRKASGAASGLIDGLGYAGAAVASAGTAYVKEAWGWSAAFNLWVGGALMAAVLMLLLWNYRPDKSRRWA
jgi:sugar phosphate permease